MRPRKEIVETENVIPIPIVDIGNLLNIPKAEFDLESPKLKEIGSNIAKVLHEHGFVYLSNHGIPKEVISKAFEESLNFFNLPKDVKMKSKKLDKDTHINFHGYSHTGRETLDTGDDDIMEWKEMFDFFTVGERKYPTEDAPNFKPTIDIMENMCRHLDTKLLRLLARAIGLKDTDYFYDRCKNLEHPEEHSSGSDFRALLYPPIPNDLKKSGTWIGCNEHKDWGVLTLLFQDNVGGLEVKTAQGDWIKATPILNTIVLNTGSLLEHWTGGYFRATPHRVHVKPIKESDKKEKDLQNARQSLVFFLQPDDEVMVETLESGILPKNCNLMPISAGKFFEKKVRLAYGQEE